MQTLHPIRMFKIVFRDRWLYPKQLPLFCLLRLISASADGIGYISYFCSMIKLLHELKNSFFYIEAFRNLIMSQQGKGKLNVCWTAIHNKKLKNFLRTSCAFCVVLQDSILQTSVQPHTFYARPLVFDKTSAQHHFAAVNCSDAVMSVFYYPVLMRSLIFLQLWTAVS